MSHQRRSHSTPGTKGSVLHAAAAYDLLAWLLLLGRERRFRDRITELAGLTPGERVLDIGCGTGSLAIAAKERVGEPGAVHGLDASPEMLARARRKASKAGLAIEFVDGVVERLPFADDSFDVVLSTLMLHHLPSPARVECLREARRVLRPGGRVLAVDFGRISGAPRGLIERIHRHGGIPLDEIVALIEEAGFAIGARGPVGVRDLSYVLAVKQ